MHLSYSLVQIKKVNLLEKIKSSSINQNEPIDPLSKDTGIHLNTMINAKPTGIKRPKGYMNCGFNSVFQCMMNTISVTKIISQGKSDAARKLRPLAQIYTEAQANAKPVAEGLNAQIIRKLAAPYLDKMDEMEPGNYHRQEDADDIWQSLAGQLGTSYVMNETSENHSKEIAESSILLGLEGTEEKFEDLMTGYFDEVTDRGERIHRSFSKAPDTLVVRAKRTFWSPEKGRACKSDVSILNVPETYTVPQKSTPTGKEKLDYQIKGCVIQKGSVDDGHFYSLQKKPDGWYLVDDQDVKKVTDEEAAKMLSKADLFFYERQGVESAVPPKISIQEAENHKPSLVESTSPTSDSDYSELAQKVAMLFLVACVGVYSMS